MESSFSDGQRYPNPSPQNVNVTVHGKMDFTDIIQGKGPEMQKLSWIIRTGPI